jgi:hypothetical protein
VAEIATAFSRAGPCGGLQPMSWDGRHGRRKGKVYAPGPPTTTMRPGGGFASSGDLMHDAGGRQCLCAGTTVTARARVIRRLGWMGACTYGLGKP